MKPQESLLERVWVQGQQVDAGIGGVPVVQVAAQIDEEEQGLEVGENQQQLQNRTSVFQNNFRPGRRFYKTRS